MANKFIERVQRGFNAFSKQEQSPFEQSQEQYSYASSYGSRPDRLRLNINNERTLIASIYTRISIDVAAVVLRHVRLDDNGRYQSTINSGLNECLNVEANKDQGARAFKQNIAMTMLDKGVIAIVPVDTSSDPNQSVSYSIGSMRVGEIIQWAPDHVKVLLYDDRKGDKKELWVAKKNVAIVENPMYAVMNEPNSTLQRLSRKLNLLDAVDEASSSGKLDIIIQLPYVIRSDQRRQQAEQRRSDIEMQLKGSKYGIAYTDGTEKITQLNRPTENNLLKQVEFLTNMLYTELGLTPEVFSGTADEKTMLNYYNRTIEPILTAISENLKRSFITKTARSQGQSIEFYRDPFKLVAIGDIAEIADKFTRNEITTSNEIRSIIGLMPSTDPKAEQLRNSNMPQSEDGPTPVAGELQDMGEQNQLMEDTFSDLESSIDKMIEEA